MKLSLKDRLRVLLTGMLPAIKQADTPLLSVVVGSWNGFTLHAWRESPDRIKYAQELFRHPIFRDLLAVLTNARPQVPETARQNPTSASVCLGTQLGYQQCLSVLFSLPISEEISSSPIEADYGASEESSTSESESDL